MGKCGFSRKLNVARNLKIPRTGKCEWLNLRGAGLEIREEGRGGYEGNCLVGWVRKRDNRNYNFFGPKQKRLKLDS